MSSGILRILRTLNLLPLRMSNRPFFWGFLSISLFISALSLHVMKGFFPVYFPFLLLLLMGIVFFFRTIGLYIAFICLSPFFYWTFKEKAIWELTLLYSLSINYFTALLALEEDYSLLTVTKAENPSVSEEKNAKWEEEKRDFQKTVEQLKEEAQRRYLETSSLQESLQNAQHLVDSQTLKTKTLEQNLSEATLALEQLRIEKEEISHRLQKALADSSLQEAQINIKELEKDLIKTNLAIEEIKKEKEEIALRMQKTLEESSHLHQELLLTREKFEEEKFKTHTLEELQNQLQATQLGFEKSLAEANSQLAIVALESAQSSEKNQAIAVLQKEIASISGKYKQLKEQFEEKTKVLSQTRKELFQAQGKLLVLEREQQLALTDHSKEDEMVFLVACEKEMEEILRLKEEIKNLEDLISNLV